MTREEAIATLTASGKRTREQAEAFLDLLGSAFARRDWVGGEPLSEEAIAERLGVFLGTPIPGTPTEDGTP